MARSRETEKRLRYFLAYGGVVHGLVETIMEPLENDIETIDGDFEVIEPILLVEKTNDD